MRALLLSGLAGSRRIERLTREDQLDERSAEVGKYGQKRETVDQIRKGKREREEEREEKKKRRRRGLWPWLTSKSPVSFFFFFFNETKSL